MSAVATQKPQSVYEAVTERIVAELERGVIPWRRPWTFGMARNAVSGRPYRGINALLAGWVALERGYQSNAFVTFLQAKQLGGHVRRGERGLTLVFWKRLTRRPSSTEGEAEENAADKTWWLLRRYTVFAVEQCEGLDGFRQDLTARLARPFTPIEEAEHIMERLGVPICYGGGRAYYDPAADSIQLPPRETFASEEKFYATALHECAHATGAPHRLARDLSGRFGSDRYSVEELTADLASCFVCARLGIDAVADSASYIESWLKVLRRDSRAIFTAARLASEAAEYLWPTPRDEADAECFGSSHADAA